MNRTIAILLALLMVLSLAACGGGGQTTPTPEPTASTPESTPEPTPEPTAEATAEPTSQPSEMPIEDYLTSTEWKAVLDYDNMYQERVFYFEKDGSGTMMITDNAGWDYTWSTNANGIRLKVEYSTAYSSGILVFNFTIYETLNSKRLIDSENYITLVPINDYDSESNIIKDELVKSVEELDWQKAHDLQISNNAKYKQEYTGKTFKWTAVVDTIGSIYCNMSIGGSKINSITVYMSNDDLGSISKGDTITVIGRLDEYSDHMYNAFIVK